MSTTAPASSAASAERAAGAVGAVGRVRAARLRLRRSGLVGVGWAAAGRDYNRLAARPRAAGRGRTGERHQPRSRPGRSACVRADAARRARRRLRGRGVQQLHAARAAQHHQDARRQPARRSAQHRRWPRTRSSMRPRSSRSSRTSTSTRSGSACARAGTARGTAPTARATCCCPRVAATGPGDVFGYLTGSFGEAEVYFDSSDGFDAATGTRRHRDAAGRCAHAHVVGVHRAGRVHADLRGQPARRRRRPALSGRQGDVHVRRRRPAAGGSDRSRPRARRPDRRPRARRDVLRSTTPKAAASARRASTPPATS